MLAGRSAHSKISKISARSRGTVSRISDRAFAVTSVAFPEEPVEDVEEEEGTPTGLPESENGSISNIASLAAAHPSQSQLRLAQRETQQIFWLKGITILIFMLASVLVSLSIYYSTSDSQQDQFEQVYGEQSHQIVENFQNKLWDLVHSLDQWALQYYPPQTTLPNYELRASSLRELAHASWIGMAPLVENRTEWELYSLENGDSWIPSDDELQHSIRQERNDISDGLYFPLWQHYPIHADLVNLDLLSVPNLEYELTLAALTNPPSMVLGYWSDLLLTKATDEKGNVSSLMSFPIIKEGTVAGVVMGWMDWSKYLQTPLDQSANGIICVLNTPCGPTTSYAFEVQVQRDKGSTMQLLPRVPSSSALIEDLEIIMDISTIFSNMSTLSTKVPFNDQYCPYTLHVYPTNQVREQFMTSQAIYTTGIVLVFVFCSVVFLLYDCLVERRQRVVMKSAVKSHEIVANLFPEVVRNRLFGEPSAHFKKKGKDKGQGHIESESDDKYVKPRMVNFLGTKRSKNSPIADLFPHTTVLFADIAGFTAWSSVRDPSQVFTLLETIYEAFDKIAVRRHVFKVETIGDCYVAVTGLPSPQEDHAIIMAKFARDSLKKMLELTQSLEVELGPDTGDLRLRIGMHSGPVTGGVLRGQKSRFQLFGDTVNTASRMESNGYPNQIQCSQQTADLLTKGGKSRWIHPRKDMVHAKGKGFVQTYWIIASKAMSSMGSQHSSIDNDDDSDITEEPLNATIPETPETPPTSALAKRKRQSDVSPHLQRLIEWNVEMLSNVIKTIVGTRRARDKLKQQDRHFSVRNSIPNLLPFGGGERASFFSIATNVSRPTKGTVSEDAPKAPPPLLVSMNNPRDEYCDAIQLPRFDPYTVVKRASDHTELKLSTAVMAQLRDLVTTIACAYNDNPFHNFEHASHVTMSANKILKRIVNADHVEVRTASLNNLASKIHDYTYGITSDPLTHFACLFYAMIHDVDHPGVSNMQLKKEGHSLADMYDGKSIAEQNSFDFAWELLMDSEFEDLRKQLFENETDLKRFRQLVVNSIMATDIFDPDLVKIRNERWQKAFPREGEEEKEEEGKEGKEVAPVLRENTTDRKATLVIEHIIQAADVAHTMQHWHVYQKWNRRLFEEMYYAYDSGRCDSNPAKFWYQGELWFYDNYIIPLAKKLKECHVFGASSDEFLTYALDNRSEWETKGQDIVNGMVQGCTQQSEEFQLMQMSRDD